MVAPPSRENKDSTMAKSTSSQHRAQLLREMNKTRPSVSSRRSHRAPSPQNTISDVFDPENEALMSTRILEDVSQKLPQLHASAEKCRRLARPTSSKDDSGDMFDDMEWDTSVLRRHFPDFTQGSKSPDNSRLTEWEMDRAAEIAGEAKANGQARGHSSRGDIFEGDTLDRQRVFIDGDKLMYTPPLTSKQPSKKTDDAAPGSLRCDTKIRQQSGLQKQVLSPSPPPAKTKDSGSDQSRKSSRESRRTLASMHARIRDEHDKLIVKEDRPPTIDLTTQNTRFANTKTQTIARPEILPTRFSSAQTLLGAVAPKNNLQRHTASTPTPQPTQTQRSFDIPAAPNLTELMSGVFENGQPVFSRNGKPRNSRFVSVLQQSARVGQADQAIEEIPVRMEEQHIYMNIHLLQDKVDVLEENRAELMNTIDELRQKNRVLKGKREFEKRKSANDSALGTTDSESGHEVGGGHRKLTIEKNRLQSSVYALQAQLDSSNRKTATIETILKNITEERDAAVSQLGVAWFTTEQLKNENQSLRAENDDLKAQIVQSTADHEKETQKMCGELEQVKAMIDEHGLLHATQDSGYLKEENNDLKSRMAQLTADYHNETQKWTAKEEAMRRMLERRPEVVRTKKEGGGLQPSGQEDKIAPASRSENRHVIEERNAGQAGASTHEEVDALFDFRRNQDVTNDVVKIGQQAIEIDDSQDSEDAAHHPSKEKGKGEVHVTQPPTNFMLRDGTSLDLTYLSFVDPKEISQLRKTLEQERIERKQREESKRQPTKGDNTVTQTALFDLTSPHSQQVVPRKSSVKDLTAQSIPKDITARSFQKDVNERSLHRKETTEHNRRHSETSILSIRSRRRGHDAEDMTSAFIVPDITIRNPVVDTSQVPELTKEAQKVLDGLANHNGKNCILCKGIISKGENHEHAKETIKISKPVPVSERILSATENDEDHTIRPSQAPGLALATVMKGLDDELAHLKIQLTKHQTLYNGQDPALSKRSRKSVHNKIETLLQAIDSKADQIYALYDVLEGQKQDGREISDEEVEVTMQSIGVGVAALHLRGGEGEKQQAEKKSNETSERHPWDLESEAESELPWEGIESTLESTKGGFSKETPPINPNHQRTRPRHLRL